MPAGWFERVQPTYAAALAHFVTAVEMGTPITPSLEDGLKAQAYGGTPGRNLDPCYHEACDSLSNIDSALLQEMSGALAYVTAAYALAPRK
jgi:hypothetical protein